MGFQDVCVYIVCLVQILRVSADQTTVYKWECENGKCVKTLNDPQNEDRALGLDACKMFCNEYGILWPRPTGEVDLGNFLSKIKLDDINVQIEKHGYADNLMMTAGERFKKMASLTAPKDLPHRPGKPVDVYLVNENPNVMKLTLTTDESYSLKVSPAPGNRLNATVVANNFFGIRHGLETLAQLFIFNEARNQMLMVRDVTIKDKPVYPYRGLLLDTARNYYSVDAIKDTIDAMAAVKLNTFHWHITDTQSFPFVSEKRPELSKLGAYSPSKVYTRQAIRDIVQYGLVRGVRVLPEFDAPAHVGEGWHSNFTVCFNAQPWSDYCVEPPCGQFNPVRDELYEYLEDIYRDMAEAFQSDIFHMGGDEVSERCWNSSTEIQQFMTQNRWELNKKGFLSLWNYFQKKAQEKVYKAFGFNVTLIMWTSTLTDFNYVENYLPKEEYIIQVWTTGSDPQIQGLLQKGYKLILSNYDALYFDCGFGSWISTGNNWCSPYIGWNKVYQNSPRVLAMQYKDQILGGEAALWSEQSDASSLDNKMWPRAAALAERLWAEPETSWSHAEDRMLNVRERLVQLGINADSLKPEWCLQNQGECGSH